MKYYFLNILLILVFSVNAQNIQPYPDNSLDLKAFMDWGIPSIEIRWNSQNYAKAFKVLEKIYELDKWSLPRKDSEYSAALFERLVATENADILIDRSLNIQQRIKEIDELARHAAMLQYLYEETREKEERFSIEVLELAYFNAYLLKNILILLQEIETLLPDSQRNSTSFQNSLQQVKVSIGDSSLLWLERLDTKRFNEKDLVIFSNKMSDFTVSIWKSIPKEKQNLIQEKVEALIKNHQNTTIKTQLRALAKSFK